MRLRRGRRLCQPGGRAAGRLPRPRCGRGEARRPYCGALFFAKGRGVALRETAGRTPAQSFLFVPEAVFLQPREKGGGPAALDPGGARGL